MATTSITDPSANCCLPTANAVADGNYDANFRVDPKIGPLDGVLYFVRVTVGSDSPKDSAGSTQVSGKWTVTFSTLTGATDVTVTSQLMKSVNGGTPTTVGSPATVAHVSVTEVCEKVTHDPGEIFDIKASTTSRSSSATAPKPNRHLSVYWPYDSDAWEKRILRAVAIVLRTEGTGTPEVWAVAEGTAHDGVATAVIPIPHTAPHTTYQYYFALFSRIDNSLLTRSPAANHPAE